MSSSGSSYQTDSSFSQEEIDLFIDSYLQFVKERKAFNADEISRMPDQISNLMLTLKNLNEDNLFISIGACLGNNANVVIEQRFPSYLQMIPKDESIRILLIDSYFIRDRDSQSLQKVSKMANIELTKTPSVYPGGSCFVSDRFQNDHLIDVFGCYLPKICNTPQAELFYSILKSAMSRILDKKGRVFIANHTQAYGLTDIPDVANSYNSIKRNHVNSSLLQLYTQGGHGKVRYYLEKLYDQNSSQYEPTAPIENAFYECNFIGNLSGIEKFYNPNTDKKNDFLVRHWKNPPDYSIEDFKRVKNEVGGSEINKNSSRRK